MKFLRLFCVILTIVLLVGSVCAPVSFAVLEEDASNTSGLLDTRVPIGGTEKKLKTAETALLYELNTGTLVYAWNVDQRINPSSMVKILTAYVAIMHGNMNDIVTVRRETLNTIPIGTVSAKLVRDEEISVLDLLYCVLVASANDASAVLAEHIAESQSEFVSLMNETARQLGCMDSNFTNVTGLNDENQYSTARDLAIITEAALRNALFKEIFCATTYTVAATNKSDARVIYTTNYMMSEDVVKKCLDARVTGGKTAAETQTSRSLICTAEVGNMQYLSIVLGAESVVSEDGLSVEQFGNFTETAELLDYGFDSFCVRQILAADEVYGQYAVSGGENDITVAPERDIYTVLPREYENELLAFEPYVDASCLQAPLKCGDTLGTLKVRYNGILLLECNLIAMYGVLCTGTGILSATPVGTIQTQKNSAWIMYVGGALAVVLLVAVLILFVMRIIRNIRIRNQHKRRKRNRRRSR